MYISCDDPLMILMVLSWEGREEKRERESGEKEGRRKRERVRGRKGGREREKGRRDGKREGGRERENMHICSPGSSKIHVKSTDSDILSA